MKRNYYLILFLFLLLVNVILFGLAWWIMRPDQASEISSYTVKTTSVINAPLDENATQKVVGDVAPDFVLQTVDGRKIDSAEFANRPRIVNFWATWCAPCRVEMPHLQAVYEKYQAQGLVILALDQDESADQVKMFFYDEMKLSFIPLLDVNSLVSFQYGAFRINPSSYFIKPDGTISAIHRGTLTPELLENYVAGILPSAGSQ